MIFQMNNLKMKIVEDFQQMISFENLRYDYTIKRIDDKIYLQWKGS